MKKPPLVVAVVVALFFPAPAAWPAEPAPAPLQADEAPAILRDWVQATYPESARKAQAEGTVTVDFVVEADGKVTHVTLQKSSDPQFDEAAAAAVQRWGFGPALSDGKPVASGLRATVEFRLAQLKQKRVPVAPPPALEPVPLPRTPPRMKDSPNPDYPAELEENKLSGRVVLEFVVGSDGTAHAPKVLWASHAAFVGPALQALAKCTFEPARQGPLILESTHQEPMEFGSLGVNRAELLAANHLEPVAKEDLQVLPEPQVLCEPVYPLERLLTAEAGAATVAFTVGEKGDIGDASVLSSTQPEFGRALLAAVESWRFSPALNQGRRVPALLRVTHDFAPPTGGPVARLLPMLRPGGAGIGGARGLDRSLAPLWRGFPVYPVSFFPAERPRGEATVEFIIDREGRVRLPRVESATHEAFGWAAAAAISQWVFEPPTRNGQPVDVRVSIPVGFAPPAG